MSKGKARRLRITAEVTIEDIGPADLSTQEPPPLQTRDSPEEPIFSAGWFEMQQPAKRREREREEREKAKREETGAADG